MKERMKVEISSERMRIEKQKEKERKKKSKSKTTETGIYKEGRKTKGRTKTRDNSCGIRLIDSRSLSPSFFTPGFLTLSEDFETERN